MAALAGLLLLGAVPARADYALLGAPEVQSWLQTTAAHALKAAQPDNDLHVGSIAALNRTLRDGLALLDRLAPAWGQRVDVALRFDHDLRASYRVGTVHPVVRVGGGDHVVDLEARLDYRPNGATRSRVGIGYRPVGPGDALEARLHAGLEQDTGHARYLLEARLDRAPLALSGRMFNDVPYAEAARRDPLLDGYELDAELRVPYVSWLRARGRLLWRENHGEPVIRDQLGLEFQPLASLRIETGSRGHSNRTREWFTRLRIEFEFGGRA